MTEQYNFKMECLKYYDQQIYELFMELFDSFPLACIVNKTYFCVHGGISDKGATVIYMLFSWVGSIVFRGCVRFLLLMCCTVI